MAADERCKEHEVLLLEMNRQTDFEFAANNNTSSRLLVNPEVVQELDQSDGSKKYDEEAERYACEYVYNKNLEFLPENKDAALRVAQAFERKIDAAGLTHQLNQSYAKFRKGVIVLDTEEPLDENLQSSFSQTYKYVLFVLLHHIS